MTESTKGRELRILMLEDTSADAELSEYELRKAGIPFTAQRVENLAAFKRALRDFHPDIILSDYNLPDCTGMDALQLVQHDHPEVPVVMVTGALTDIEAVELIHAGAKDYVLKDRLARLAPAVQRALAMEQSARARADAEQALRKSYDDLEMRVRQRTAEWTIANAALKLEKDEQTKLIKELAAAHSQMLQSEMMASLGQLAAGAAHEISDPVGFVVSSLGTMGKYIHELSRVLAAYESHESELPPESRAAIAAVRQQADLDFMHTDTDNLLAESLAGLQRVNRIVHDLRDFSLVDKQEKQPADLERGLDSTLNIIWNKLKDKAEIVKEYAGIPRIKCLLPQLNQVFMHLLVNAGQAIDDHGRITIRTGETDNEVWVEIEDTGRGILPEHMKRIFDPFFTTRPTGAGTGLGLSLSNDIVHEHGGRIEVKSEFGRGSVFRVVLPKDANPV